MANASHEKLFDRYVKTLEWAIEEASTLRQEDLERLIEDFGGDRARAEEAFAGHGLLCSDPYIIGAVREYWLKCDELNRTESGRFVDPLVFILDWLRGARAGLAEIIERYPYWPIGQDAKGRWI